MQNVTMRIDGNKLVIEVDLTKEIGPRRFLVVSQSFWLARSSTRWRHRGQPTLPR
jgi:hypothetical protein